MSKYFFKIDQHYTDKRKLDQDFSKFITKHDSTMLPNNQAKDDFIKMLENKLEALQIKYPRAKEIPLDINGRTEDRISLRSSSVSANIFKVKTIAKTKN